MIARGAVFGGSKKAKVKRQKVGRAARAELPPIPGLFFTFTFRLLPFAFPAGLLDSPRGHAYIRFFVRRFLKASLFDHAGARGL
jgi:hypothetical protein